MEAHSIFDWSPSAIVFDCDGTLVDTEQHWHDARLRAIRDFGLSPLPRFAERTVGLHYVQCGMLMAQEGGKPDLTEDVTARLLEHFTSLVSERPMTLPGVARLVELASGSMPLAVASNCPQVIINSCLSRAGLLKHFSHVVVPDETLRPKPHPDVYARAALLCGVPPTDCLAVEDSLPGIESAREAGLRVLGVGERCPGTAQKPGPDLWVSSLEDPALVAWSNTRLNRPERR